MRKNFLLLMLMALLPLAGWADTAPAAATVTYNGSENELISAGEATGKTFWYAVVADGAAAPATTAYATTLPKGTAAGAYDVYWVSKTTGEELVASDIESATKIDATISKAALTVTATAVTITYGESFTATYTFSGLADVDKVDATADNPQPKTTAVSISAPEVKNGSVTYAGNAGTYTITPVMSSDNYDITLNTGTLTVNQKSLNADDITIATPAGGTYTGAVQTRTATVTDTRDVINADLDADLYEISYTYSATGADASDFTTATSLKNAGWYKQVATAKAGGNYKDAKTSEAFQIARAELMAQAADKTVVYTGTAPTYAAADIIYEGLLGDDTATTDGTSPAFTTLPTVITTTITDAGTYEVEPSGAVSTNYEMLYVAGTLTINKNKIKITALSPTAVKYGASAAYAKAAGSIKKSEIASYIKINLQKQDGTYDSDVTSDSSNAISKYMTTSGSGDNTVISGLALACDVTETSAVGEYDIVPSGAVVSTKYITDTSGPKYSDNYEFVYDKGTYKIEAQTYTFKVANKSKDYGTADPPLTYTINEAISEEDEAEIRANVTLTRVEGETAGNYTISMAVAEGFDPSAKYAINTTATGKLIIKKANLTIAASAQTLYKYNTVAKLGQEEGTNYTVTGLVSNDDLEIADVAEVKLVFGTTDVTDEETTVPVFTEAEAASDENATAGALKTDGTYNYGIKVVLANQEDLAANYNITLTNAALTVIDASTALTLSFTADNTEAIEAAASTDTGKTVTFGARTLAADTWGVLVLPFATTVREISTALGYAVVDVLDQTKGDGSNVYFKIHMGDIAANTPFMVKSDQAVDFSATTVKFTDKTIVTTGITDGKTAAVKDAGDTEFIGFYKGQSFTGAKQLWLSGDGVWGYNKNGNTVPVGPTRAYLQLPAESTGAHIFIEEIDGSVTAISTINAEGEAVAADGWYTLNGIRLEGAPTEKGIYVRNGKKVVIK